MSLLIQRILLNFASRHLRLGGLLCGGHGLSELRSGLCLPGTTVGKTVNCHYPLHWQDLELFFTYGHRRSCSILQRNSTEDASITQRMSELLKFEDGREDGLEKIDQSSCQQRQQRVNIETDLLDVEVGLQAFVLDTLMRR